MSLTDDDLKAELKKFGETVTIKITDKNRDIYIKKLNHYKARQKVEENPSKYAKKLNMSSKYKLNDNNEEDDDDEDSIQPTYRRTVATSFENNDTTYEYVQVNNAHTSPLSNSIYNTRSRKSNDNYPSTPNVPLNYNRLKDRIDLEKTVQKYKNEIEGDILDPAKARSRLINNSIINASSFNQSKFYPNNKNFTSTLLEAPPIKQNKLETINSHYQVSARRPMSKMVNQAENENISKDFFLKLSKWLPYLFGFIILILALAYARIKMQEPDSNISKLFITNKPNIQDMYCEDIKECSSTKALIRELIEYLRVKSGNAECKNLGENSKYAHYDEVVRYFKKKNSFKITTDEQDSIVIAMNSIIKAIKTHPHWGIRLFDQEYNKITDLENTTYFMSEVAFKSFSCRVSESIQTISMNILITFLTIFIIVAIYMIIKTIYTRNQESKKKFYELVNQVVELVQRQNESSLENAGGNKPYIAISHVYDSLFDHSERNRQKSLWDKIVKYISDNESRIRVETQFYEGEETLVWRWVVPANVIPSSPRQPAIQQEKTNKVLFNETNVENRVSGWQNSQNLTQDRSLHTSPTSCLKIRNMFDQRTCEEDPLFLIKIHNDILAKCSHVRSILHISCDKNSKEGCVYIKCSDNEAAGLAYTILNNAVYNDKMLSVKFLQEFRYLQRFPESKHYIHQLKPM